MKEIIKIIDKLIEKIDRCENTLDADLFGKINVYNELLRELEEK